MNHIKKRCILYFFSSLLTCYPCISFSDTCPCTQATVYGYMLDECDFAGQGVKCQSTCDRCAMGFSDVFCAGDPTSVFQTCCTGISVPWATEYTLRGMAFGETASSPFGLQYGCGQLTTTVEGMGNDWTWGDTLNCTSGSTVNFCSNPSGGSSYYTWGGVYAYAIIDSSASTSASMSSTQPSNTSESSIYSSLSSEESSSKNSDSSDSKESSASGGSCSPCHDFKCCEERMNPKQCNKCGGEIDSCEVELPFNTPTKLTCNANDPLTVQLSPTYKSDRNKRDTNIDYNYESKIVNMIGNWGPDDVVVFCDGIKSNFDYRSSDIRCGMGQNFTLVVPGGGSADASAEISITKNTEITEGSVISQAIRPSSTVNLLGMGGMIAFGLAQN